MLTVLLSCSLLLSLGLCFAIWIRLRREKRRLQTANSALLSEMGRYASNYDAAIRKASELRESQDGDYYLTSLLIMPLAGVHCKPKRIGIEIHTAQKKQFVFRQWKTELGGDLIRVDRLTLRKREYVVFMNADAMGKSMQGAGGALVLGTVFKSIVARTQASMRHRDRYPEQWLKECYDELDSVFVSFDGTMLVSCAFGLLDETSGLFYWVNADHPRVVLLRAGKAIFLEEENRAMFKLGMPPGASRFKVQLFMLEPQDVLYAGSDGRDDILMLQADENGHRIINDDEMVFLKCVERSKGTMKDLLEELDRWGEFTDDLTLLRLGFAENEPIRQKIIPDATRETLEKVEALWKSQEFNSAAETLEGALRLAPGDEQLLIALAKSYLHSDQYAEAARTIEVCMDSYPGNGEAILLAANAYKMLNDYAQATDCGERLRLREPKNITNLANLADIYRRSGNHARSELLIQMGLQIEPGNRLLAKVAARLRGNRSNP